MAQLARTVVRHEPPDFCPVAPGALVRICSLIVKEFPWPAWLCPKGMREAVAGGLTVRDRRAPPHDELPCDAHRGGGCGK